MTTFARYVGGFKRAAPVRDQLTITGEHDSLVRDRRDVHRQLTVVERLGDQLSHGG